MTNYNKRLEEIITICDFEPEGFNSRVCKWCGKRKGAKIHTAKQAITSLIKELVAEAKPDTSGFSDEYWRVNGSKVILMFEANLLKALEEV